MPEVGPDEVNDRTQDRGPVEVVRSEERLRVRMERLPRGVRVRKRVVTETRQITVQVRREEIEFEPVGAAEAGAAGGYGTAGGGGDWQPDLEIVLHEERPVVTMDVVPVERVRVGRRVVTEQRAVEEELRREVVEVEGATPR